MTIEERHLRRFRDFMTAQVERPIGTALLSKKFGRERWQRHLSILRNYEGYQVGILGGRHIENAEFVVLKSANPTIHFAAQIGSRTRRLVSKKGDLACRMCGYQSGDRDPTTEGRRIRLFASHAVDPNHWTGPEIENIEAICIACREGLGMQPTNRQSTNSIKEQLRRASPEQQFEILGWLASIIAQVSSTQTEISSPSR